MKFLICLFLCVVTASVHAQYEQRSTLGMSGSTSNITFEETNYYISASIGQQGVIGTISNGTYTMRQGFQQPPIRVVASPNNSITLDAVIFPNPVNSFVTVRFGTLVENEIQSVLYDIQGRVIINNTITPVQSFQVDLSHLAAGTYILKITVASNSFSTRLIKN